MQNSINVSTGTYYAQSRADVVAGRGYSPQSADQQMVELWNVTSSMGDGVHPRPQSFVKDECHGMTGYQLQYEGISGALRSYGNRGNVGLWFPTGVPFSFPPDVLESLRAKAMDRFYAKIRGSGNFAVDFAEAPETGRMFRNFKNFDGAVTKMAHDVIAGRFGRSRKAAAIKVLANGWLLYRYGVMPLVYSTYDILDTYGRRFENKLSEMIEGSASQRDLNFYETGALPTGLIRDAVFRSTRVKIGICLSRPSETQLYDYTSLNPLGIAWELVPLSFVADWFVNVSQVLQQWENWFIFRSGFDYGYETVTSLYTVQRSDRRDNVQDTRYASNGSVLPFVYGVRRDREGSWQRKVKDRRVLSGLPLPASLGLSVNLNAKRCADAVAITHGFIARFRF